MGRLVLLEKPVVGERDVAAVADHDVIEKSDAEKLTGLLEALGDRLILGARVATRMVVYDDDRGPILRYIASGPNALGYVRRSMTRCESFHTWTDGGGSPWTPTACFRNDPSQLMMNDTSSWSRSPVVVSVSRIWPIPGA